MSDIDAVGELYGELSDLFASGREQEARDLLFEKFDTLPEEIQGKIVLAFLTEDADANTRGTEAVAKMQEQGLSAVKVLEAIKGVLEK